jgi:hypothetical protein
LGTDDNVAGRVFFPKKARKGGEKPGKWSVVSGQLPVVSCQLSVVSGQWAVVADGESFSVSVGWNRTGSVGRFFLPRKNAEERGKWRREFSTTKDTNDTKKDI